MQMNVLMPSQRPRDTRAVACHEDPLDRDSVDDAEIVTTRRSLLRVALVAAETASRFAREQVGADPMAWMLTPRRLFDGRAAIDGCLCRDECLRAVLLHGLSIGMDAEPAEIDALTDEDEGEDVAEDIETTGGDVTDRRTVSLEDRGLPRPRLWTSFLVVQDETGAVQAFDALIAPDRREAEARLRARHGARLADGMEVVEGFDPNLPLAEALISPALADMLSQVAADPGSPLAEGLTVSVMQRFIA
ncbi:hypothetical protein [Sphingomonas sp. R86521]|uniref:hypothetical protein n=1 Tax=Sphingomonas sp. R86521 TaxID=3093860 RepID=UPI0036D22991